MGVDLTLLPFDGDLEFLSFSHTVLQVARNYELFEKINKLQQIEIGDGFTSYVSHDDKYEESHYGDTTKDCYGGKVKYVLAKDLKTVDIGGPTGAYIAALHDNNKVALFWW